MTGSPTACDVSWVTWAFRLGFLFFFALGTLPLYFLTLATDILLEPLSAEGRRRRGRWMAKISSALWRVAISCCVWLRIDSSGLAPFIQRGGQGRRVFLCANHTSFLDTPVICVTSPWWIIPDLKVLMAQALMDMPLLGRCAKAVGHIALPFKARTNHDFSMDQDKLEKIMKQIDEHIEHDGHVVLFPEGYINTDWQTLRTFRGGGFELAIKHDMEVWGMVTAGSAKSWPKEAVLGGGPSRISVKAVLLHESGKEAAERLCPGGTIQEQGRALAAKAQSTMQGELDELVKSGGHAVKDKGS